MGSTNWNSSTCTTSTSNPSTRSRSRVLSSSKRHRRRSTRETLSSSTDDRLGTMAWSCTERRISGGIFVLELSPVDKACTSNAERGNGDGDASSGRTGGDIKRVTRIGTLSARTSLGRPAPRRMTAQRLFHTLDVEVLAVAVAPSPASASPPAEWKRARAWRA